MSSTYEDLKDERREVTQALLELDCLPAGMEMFVAANEEQWDLIEEVISESDYYILIIGGRYGSIAESGVSYTEREFDLALKLKIPVMVFVPKDPDSIPQGKTDKDDTARTKLDKFRKKAMNGRNVAFYADAHDLGSQVSRAMVRAIKKTPGIGWVRGNQAMTVEQQKEIADLRTKLSELQAEKLAVQTALVEDIARLAQGDEEITLSLRLTVKQYHTVIEQIWVQITTTWDALFAEIGPLMIDEDSEENVKQRLAMHLYFDGEREDDDDEKIRSLKNPELEAQFDQWDMVVVQLRALGLIDTGAKKRPIQDQGKYLTLTQKGRRHLTTLRAIQKGTNPGKPIDNDSDPWEAEAAEAMPSTSTAEADDETEC
ncbi:DUF4062 domain-containing protein [Mycolicibacterium sp. J2]|uniref:DUF4062 domain-containing protein n=1 Tax=Mycolicibacterium sp. J2 TaxID=2993511 RepID=UPI00224AAFCB|nr:DUF4062 domain-containing protein [Mycolicibacterium sp. J2]MCX2714224.1 DUF4062 domain-containing protein [Mycolicibacterium sp. J2]